MPGALLTLLLQRAILGIESYLPGAVYFQLGIRGKLDQTTVGRLRNPASLAGRKMVEKYYRGLPALVDPGWSLQELNRPLWKATVRFYEEVRNPLMHGYEVDPKAVDGVYQAFEHLAQLYKWIDGWHNPRSWWPPPASTATGAQPPQEHV